MALTSGTRLGPYEITAQIGKGMLELEPHEQALVAAWKHRPDGTVEIKFENRLKAIEMLAKHYGLLKAHVQLETTSELTPAEQERINGFTDKELREFNEANDTIHRLLYEEVP